MESLSLAFIIVLLVFLLAVIYIAAIIYTIKKDRTENLYIERPNQVVKTVRRKSNNLYK